MEAEYEKRSKTWPRATTLASTHIRPGLSVCETRGLELHSTKEKRMRSRTWTILELPGQQRLILLRAYLLWCKCN